MKRLVNGKETTIKWLIWSESEDKYLDPVFDEPMEASSWLRESGQPKGSYSIDLHIGSKEEDTITASIWLEKEGDDIYLG